MARSREEGRLERILDAAFEVFGERGFQGTTLREIAARVGISAGSIYNYFTDKDKLFEAAVARGWDHFVEGLETIIATVPCREERIASLVGSGFATLERALPLLQGMLFEASRRHLLAPKLEKVEEAIDRLLAPDEPGLEPRLEPEERRRALIRIIVLGVLSSAAQEEGRPGTGLAGLRAAIEALLSGLGRGLPSPVPRKDCA